MNLIKTLHQPSVGEVRQPQPAALFGDTPSQIRGPAPCIGEHTRDIMRELGFTDNEIEAVIAEGAAKAA
jgi:crotonobetainyl-CoA:carnitine CoA-transferase CaiB-like acyl-CoA transferase